MVACSLIPGALSIVNKTMEETFMKFDKSAGGFSGIFHMGGEGGRRRELEKTEIEKSEKAVIRFMTDKMIRFMKFHQYNRTT